MKLQLTAAALILGLTGCASPAPQATPTPTNPSVAAAQLPKSCQIKPILDAIDGFQAWDKTEPANQGKQLNCMMGYPNSDVGFTLDFTFQDLDAWTKWRKTAITGDWIADTLTDQKYSTVYRVTPNEGLGEGVEVKIFVRGVVIDYNSWGGIWDRNDPALLGAIGAVPELTGTFTK